MKLSLKHIYLYSLIGLGASTLASCDSFLDREPITSVTPEAYFSTVDQVGAYVINYYSWLQNSRGQSLFHDKNWRSGMTLNDNNTDNLFSQSGDLNYFAGEKLVPAGKNFETYYSRIRTWNWLLEQILPKEEAGTIQGDEATLKHYIGEAYFFRALAYYQALVRYGDMPIIEKVLSDDAEELKALAVRAPRNEVARFILKDLDTAISRLQDQGFMNNQRINKQTAQLLKSRVALFEATFERYHQGTGRVPGDESWPGKNMSYNQGKTFDIAGEIDFFLTEAMSSAKAVADHCTLTENSHQMNPTLGQTNGWNPYFDMFSSENLSSISEVLLWKEYNLSIGYTHDAGYILSAGGDQLGLSRSYITSFLMQNGLPWYADNSGYQGDTTVSLEKQGRDERLQLFVMGEDDVTASDPRDPKVAAKNDVTTLDTIPLLTNSLELLDFTGYRPRKYYSYDYDQYQSNTVICTTGAVVFRAAEAYLNYIEACYEKNHNLDPDAERYWKAIRKRAGVSEDYELTVANTDLAKEVNIVNGTVYGDLAVYSGDQPVDAMLYNIRRERRCEFISEGMRWDDLKRWRSWDLAINGHYMLEGMNFWDETYKKYENSTNPNTPKLKADGSSDANMSAASVSKYIRPMGRTQINDQLFDGYTWKKAYYLEPFGVMDFTLTATDPNNVETSSMYQNPYWPMTAGRALE